MNQPPCVYINGEPAGQLSIADRGLLYGDGLFETIAVRNGRPALLAKHLQRLQRGLQTLAFPEIDVESLSERISNTARLHGDAVLRLTISRGPSGRGYAAPQSPRLTEILDYSTHRFPMDGETVAPVNMTISNIPLVDHPMLAGIKHLNRLPQVLAATQCREAGFDEAILSGSHGEVIEAVSANLFIYRDNILHTPDLKHAGIAGVMRALVLEIASSLRIPCKMGTYDIDDCLQADALFLSNSIRAIIPVAQLDGHQFPRNNWPENLFREVLKHAWS